MDTHSYQINAPDVVAESFDDEIVIVNLRSGCYYSIDHAGAYIWNLITQGVAIHNVLRAATARSHDSTEDYSTVAIAFVKQLEDEQLIIPRTNGQTDHEAPSLQPSEKIAFEKPTLNKYSDMKDLLLLDPIHDVDEKGWPIAKKQS